MFTILQHSIHKNKKNALFQLYQVCCHVTEGLCLVRSEHTEINKAISYLSVVRTCTSPSPIQRYHDDKRKQEQVEIISYFIGLLHVPIEHIFVHKYIIQRCAMPSKDHTEIKDIIAYFIFDF